MIEKLTLEDFNHKVFDLENKSTKFVGSKPIVLDFFATWCSPCKAMYPTIEKLSEEFLDEIDFYKIDVDSSDVSPMTRMFSIRSIPTLVYIDADGHYTSISGAYPESQLRTNIKEFLHIG